MDDGRVMVGDTCMKELDGISINPLSFAFFTFAFAVIVHEPL